MKAVIKIFTGLECDVIHVTRDDGLHISARLNNTDFVEIIDNTHLSDDDAVEIIDVASDYAKPGYTVEVEWSELKGGAS